MKPAMGDIVTDAPSGTTLVPCIALCESSAKHPGGYIVLATFAGDNPAKDPIKLAQDERIKRRDAGEETGGRKLVLRRALLLVSKEL